MPGEGPDRIQMTPEVLLAGPTRLGQHDDGIVGANIGLVEDEGLLLAGGPPVLHFLHEFVVESALVHEFGLEGGDTALHHVALLLPARFLLCEQLDLLVQVLHDPVQRVRVVRVVL